MKIIFKYLLVTFLCINLQFTYCQVNSSEKIKIDGVAAVVGDYVILESDVDKTLIDLQSQGVSTSNIGRCSLLGKLMEDKLYAHHAEQDSLQVDNNQIYSYVDRTIEYFVDQLGSLEKVLEFYKKTDEQSFRSELFEINKLNQLSEKMQSQIVDEVEITPEEVRQFFNSIPKYERPVFGAELEIAQIVINPKVSEEDEQKVIKRLETIKNDIEVNGASFATKAILYSQDPGSRATGGKYILKRNRPQMDKDFRDVAYRLREGEISDPFKTQFGWHIIKNERIRGQEIDVRHILLIPDVTNESLLQAKKKIDIIRKRIVDGELTFDEAAKSSSDEIETRSNGGVLINPTTGDTRFELTKMDPVLYSQAQKLKDNEVSAPLLEEDNRGIKKYKIIKVSNRFDEHIADFSQDYIKIKELALKEKQLNKIKNWMIEKIDETYINVNQDNQDCNFTNKWVKK
ncbi:MAG: peptidylprolyl isomerase [Flavobacteriaceae bacterium]